jgi:putative lipoic acid-binding regulatory protein
MTDYDRDKLLEFPCSFPLKVMGKNHCDFEVYVLSTVNKHVGGHLTENALKSRPSKNGNYVSLTVTFEAKSQQQIDDIYIELTAHELVLMAL